MNKTTVLLAALLFAAGSAWASVDVNTATRDQLEAEGMGPVAAQAIIDYRSKNGPFKSPDEVRKVISDAIAGRLSIGISVSGPPPANRSAAAPAKEDKATAARTEKAAEPKPSADDNDPDNVRSRAKKDQDDRKT
jgi:competence protein ComEA